MNRMDKIEILDKISGLNCIVPKPEFVFHPLNDQQTDLKEMEAEYLELGMEITGVIFKEDGTTMVLYKKIGKKE